MACENCRNGDPIFSPRVNLCCRVRLFFREPRIDVRRALLDHWQRILPDAQVDLTQKTIKRLWPYRNRNWLALL